MVPHRETGVLCPWEQKVDTGWLCLLIALRLSLASSLSQLHSALSATARPS